ncbi:unnamed protein product [Clonostachys chloroleuca]|uniref:Uncharacterized protein n=1 Tax=Clonostachys chloroleuca TaxID=1926264 RepID=A0AA35MDX4_9HYPO|nr:unnamed protein product [Clonostachys chloroleuca]
MRNIPRHRQVPRELFRRPRLTFDHLQVKGEPEQATISIETSVKWIHSITGAGGENRRRCRDSTHLA